jgi:hypothetical protein
MWRRERVGITSTTVEAGAKKERVHGMDPAAIREAVDAASRRSGGGAGTVWTRRRSVRCRHGLGGCR